MPTNDHFPQPVFGTVKEKNFAVHDHRCTFPEPLSLLQTRNVTLADPIKRKPDKRLPGWMISLAKFIGNPGKTCNFI
jgi:hypothetical protein